MAAQELQGKTLGEKHRNYNKLVEEALTGQAEIQIGDLNASDLDVHNLVKIDITAKNRNVVYILKVLQCEDMLYVSRAIKQSSWLITNRQYAHIINPHYLHTHLFPQMMAKAIAKLLLNIRLKLKDEDRVDAFYNYIKEKDENAALKWLPNCSLPLAEREVKKYHVIINYDINKKIFKRLCEKSIKFLEICIKDNDYPGNRLQKTMFLLNRHTKEFLDFTETHVYHVPSFNPRTTSILMKACRQRIIDKFNIYSRKVDLPTFAKHLKKEEIQDLISKASKEKDMQSWFIYENLKHLVRYLPKEGRFDFLKALFINKSMQTDQNEEQPKLECSDSTPSRRFADIYRWYRFAPFEDAFTHLIKLIRAESSPPERIAMLRILLSCADRNTQHVHTVLQYYSDKHINEPFIFKMQFTNLLLKKTKTYKFNEITWNILNKIFHSMEIYIESENDVQFCIEAIIVYKLLHNENMPEIIENKFKFKTMKSIQKNLTIEENEKVFTFLYKFIENKIKTKSINNENELTEAVKMLEDIQSLFTDWKKDVLNCPWILEKIEELVKIKNANSWKVNLSTLYHKNKSWRRVMFKESLLLSPSEETCYNALKHDPELMVHYKSAVEELRRDDSVSLRRVLRALRVYWPQSLAAEWVIWYFSQLNQPSSQVVKAVTRGFCTLAPQRQVIEFMEKYTPTEYKINWTEDNEFVLSLRKQLGRNVHVSRPLFPLEIILLYSKGDYLQFSIPSLNVVFYNMSAAQTREHIVKLLDAPVSLQKHGIRLAFAKLESEELKKVFDGIWSRTKNASIRAVLFKQTYELLCKQTKPTTIEEIWALLSIFIENLTTDENKIIYNTLSKYDTVPKLVKGNFFMKSFKFLKTLPPHQLKDCDNDIQDFKSIMSDLIEHLDSDFVAKELLETMDDMNVTGQHSELMASYLLYAKNAESQAERYKNVFVPLIERSFSLWDTAVSARFLLQYTRELSKNFQKNVLQRKMVFPTKLFREIQMELVIRLPVEKYYQELTTWKLFVTFMEILKEHRDTLATIVTELTDYEIAENKSNPYYYYDPKNEKKYNKIYMKAVPKFSKICLEYLREDVDKYFPSICWIFATSLENAFKNINLLVYLECLKLMLEDDNFVPSYLVVLESVSRTNLYDGDLDDEFDPKIDEIREKIFAHPSAEIKFHYYKKYPRHI